MHLRDLSSVLSYLHGAGHERELSQAAEPLLRSDTRPVSQPQEHGQIEAAANDLEGRQSVCRRANGHQHLAQDTHEHDDQHHHGDAQVHGLRLPIIDRTEARRGQLGLQDDTEQQHVEPPREDARQHGGSQLVLSRRSREPGPGGCIADQPDGQHAQPIQDGQPHEVGDRPHAVFGAGICRQPCPEPVKQES